MSLLLVAAGGANAQFLGGKRLSDWLLEQPQLNESYPLGLSWRIPQEIPPQNAKKLGLLKRVSEAGRNFFVSKDATERMREWLQSLPATGRVRIALANARWLQSDPMRDPVILPGHSVILPVRPKTVTVVKDDGRRCTLPHVEGRESLSYVIACNTSANDGIDWIWIGQPDGKVQKFGAAVWNEEKQDEPAPGAWIWAPRRDSGWSMEFSDHLIEFLATQGPASDSSEINSANRPHAGMVREGNRLTTRNRILPIPSTRESQFPSFADESLPQAQSTAYESISNIRSRSLESTANNWGNIGLMQTSSARFRKAGEFAFNLSHTFPYTHGNIFLQPFDWLETGFRYTDVSNRLYGPVSLSGNQSYKDKSVDFKIKLANESAQVPQIAIGVRDLTGTGLYSGEYMVASKRTGPLDWSLGMGWGYVGARGNIRNPLSRYLSSFDSRTRTIGLGGNLALSSYFRGPASMFGGVQYQTPWEKLILKVEYDGNDYQHEPQGNNQVSKTALNAGLVYRMFDSTDLTVSIERGNTISIGLALHTQLDELSVRKTGDPRRLGVVDARPTNAPNWAATLQEISTQTDWQVTEIVQIGRDLRISVDSVAASYLRERIDRVVSVLHRDAPASVDRFVIAYHQNGLSMVEHVIDRDTWVAQRIRTIAPHEWSDDVIARTAFEQKTKSPFFHRNLPPFEAGLGFNLQKNLGGPDGFVLYQIGAVERAKLRLRDDAWVQGSLQVGLLDNYNKFKFAGSSNLPRVRTFLREYLTTSDMTIPNLQISHVGRVGQNNFYSLYGGLLEPMFAGVGGEWLYRPLGSRLAYGVDLNAVQQRGFRQDFELRDYKVLTGHATLYWDTGWNDVYANVATGRYLAKDIGATFTLSRVFKNGVTAGAYFSKTNLSAEQFGEGSFDKGVFLSIPFDAFLTQSSNTIANFLWQPLIRDGAARLWRGEGLYGMTDIRSNRALEYRPAPPPNDEVIPADRRETWTPKDAGLEPYTRVSPKVSAEQWSSDPKQSDRLHDALYAQYFRDIRIEFDSSYRLILQITSDRISPVSLAVGRAARTALRLAPLETREIRVVFTDHEQPIVTYDFVDLNKLDSFFQGKIAQTDIADVVAVRYMNRALREANPLARLDDLEPIPERRLVDVMLPETSTVNRVVEDVTGAAKVAATTDWLQLGLLGSGLVLASSALDTRVDNLAKKYVDKKWVKTGVNIGNALPFVAIGGAVLAAVGSNDPKLSSTAFAATEAGGTSYAAVIGLKYMIGRARPTNQIGSKKFKFFSNTAGYDSFPSGHTIEAWSLATPFAEAYEAPWLYGVAAVTNLARIGSRQHWLSDTVAGSVLGYGIGQFFYQSSRNANKGEPRVSVDPTGINLAWQW